MTTPTNPTPPTAREAVRLLESMLAELPVLTGDSTAERASAAAIAALEAETRRAEEAERDAIALAERFTWTREVLAIHGQETPQLSDELLSRIAAYRAKAGGQ